MNLVQFLFRARKLGGGSYNLNTGRFNPSTGFMVAVNCEKQLPVLSKELVKTYLAEFSEQLAADDAFFGLWLADGVWYYDVSKNVTRLSDAIRLGLAFDQLAIWDCENAVSIELPKRQTAGTLAQQKAYVDSVVERIEKGRKV